MDTTNLNNLLQIIVASGDDVQTFLQGQLTNDIFLLNNDNSKNWQFSAYLNTKGRILATFIVVKASNNMYYLITSGEVVNQVLARLKMYVLRAKVTLEILAAHVIFSQAPAVPTFATIALDNKSFLHITQEPVTNSDLQAFKQYLVNDGIGLIYTATQDELIPQHINFDKLGGLNFKKGCYVGQEIVARMHYLGKSKRAMYRFSTEHEVAIGNKVISPKMNNQQVGIIVELAANSGSSGYSGLVSVQIDCVNDIYLDLDLTEKLVLQEITYHG